MVEPPKNPIMSVADYLDWEAQQVEKHDFFGHEVFAMTGGTLRLEVYRRNAAGRFELFVFEGADSEAELASIAWRGPVATLLD